MKKNTKILIGVGIAVAVYLIYKKSKYIPATTTTSTATAPIKGCPDGTTEVAVDCVQAPCPTQCVENEAAYQIMPVPAPKRPTGEYEIFNPDNIAI